MGGNSRRYIGVGSAQQQQHRLSQPLIPDTKSDSLRHAGNGDRRLLNLGWG